MAQHEETNSETNNDDDLYVYDDSDEDSEDEVSELDVASFRARFVSKPEKPETRVERGQTATLECAVDRLVFKSQNVQFYKSDLCSTLQIQVISEWL